MKPDNLKLLIDRDEEENIAQGIYIAVFCLFCVLLSVGAFLWSLFKIIFVA